MLHCLGPAVQRIFNTLPGEHKSLEEAKTVLNGNVVGYNFRSRAQKADESFDAYQTSLRELVKSCDFGTLAEEMIGDQIIGKCSSQTLKQKLLQQEDLDLAKMSVQEAWLLSQGTRENPIQIDHVHASRGSQAKTFSCYRCGGTDGHAPDECGAITSRCNKCKKKVSHLQRVCRSKSKADQRKGKKGEEKKPPMKVRSLNSNLVQTGLKTAQMTRAKNLYSPSTMVTVPIKMIVDTGSKYDIISSELQKTQFKNYELSQTQKRFTAYGQKGQIVRVPLTLLIG